MSSTLGDNVWVFHAGALGDHVMIWPLVRAMARQGTSVTVVAAQSHAGLCEAVVGREVGEGVLPATLNVPAARCAGGSVHGIGAEQRRFTRLWMGSVGVERADTIPGVAGVLSFVASNEDDAGRTWLEGARVMFPGATIRCVGAPATVSRTDAWEHAGVERFGRIARVSNPCGPIVLFVGTGGGRKQWPLGRWRVLAEHLRSSDRADPSSVCLLAGPVEKERWSEAEQVEFQGIGGEFLMDAQRRGGLAERCGSARLFVGCDTGPTHLAAQMGVPTLALFGPTDPAVWAPVGPRVWVVSPANPREMEWLEVGAVAATARAMLRT